MPWINDACSPLVANCVVLGFRDLCLDRATLRLNVQGTVSIHNFDGTALVDNDCIFFTNCTPVENISANNVTRVTEDGELVDTEAPFDPNICQYFAIKTCALPANIDSDWDPEDPASESRALTPHGTYYRLNLKVNNKDYVYEFQIDAAADYEEWCDCIPIKQLTVDGSFPPQVDNPFVDAVCDAIHQFEDSGECLPFDGTIKVVGVDANGDCKLYDVMGCTAESRQNIANLLAGAFN